MKSNQPPADSTRLRPAVVLVADRTLSARYSILFEGIFATMQTTQVPQVAMRHFVSPPVAVDRRGRARAAPLGIRRIESSLVASGLGENDVVCATPESLGRLLGPWTKIVSVSSSDPLGMGMTNTTTTQFWKGKLYTGVWMEQLMGQIRLAKIRHGFTVIGGGGGAWQWVQNPTRAREQGFDIIFDGYFEGVGPALVRDILAGRRPPETVVTERGAAVGGVQPIRGSSVLGAIELSRGCGKGCKFCTSAARAMEHLDEGTILADLRANVSGGMRNVVSGSEDFFRYGCAGARVNFERLRALLEAMRQVEGLSFMQIDHANVSSVLQFDDGQLREIRRLLQWDRPSKYLWVNMGIESAGGALVAANCPGKFAPFDGGDWEGMVRQAVEKLERTGFFPVLSVVLGLPGETPDDVRKTIELVKHLSSRQAVVFPIFHEPVLGVARKAGQAFGLGEMSLDHLELYTACYENNFRQVPKLFWDNQRCGGVGLARRTLVQLLGKTEVRAWRRNFVRVRKQIISRNARIPIKI